MKRKYKEIVPKIAPRYLANFYTKLILRVPIYMVVCNHTTPHIVWYAMKKPPMVVSLYHRRF